MGEVSVAGRSLLSLYDEGFELVTRGAAGCAAVRVYGRHVGEGGAAEGDRCAQMVRREGERERGGLRWKIRQRCVRGKICRNRRSRGVDCYE